MTYAKLISWHRVSGVSRANRPLTARCGKPFPVDAPTSETLPLDERSCESCLRLVAHDAERTA